MTDAFDANLLEVLPIDFGLSFSVCNNNDDDLDDDEKSLSRLLSLYQEMFP